MKNWIKNYFFKRKNNGYNSFEYKKPKIGSMFFFEYKEGNGKVWFTNYVKNRELKFDYIGWKPC